MLFSAKQSGWQKGMVINMKILFMGTPEFAIPVLKTLLKLSDVVCVVTKPDALVGRKKVLYSEVDTNMHLNNTYYADVLWSYIPDVVNKKVRGINLSFHHEAPLGCEMEIQRAEKSENEYCFKTFVDGNLNIEAVFHVENI